MAVFAARREANAIPQAIDTAPHAVDPPKAQGLVHRFWPGNAVDLSSLFVKADQQFLCLLMVVNEPFAEILGGRKVGGLHGCATFLSLTDLGSWQQINQFLRSTLATKG
jgi:hypothetical protein